MNKAEITDLYTRLNTNDPKTAAQIAIDILICDGPDGFYRLEHAAALLGISLNALCRHICWKRINPQMIVVGGNSMPHIKDTVLATFISTYPDYKTMLV